MCFFCGLACVSVCVWGGDGTGNLGDRLYSRCITCEISCNCFRQQAERKRDGGANSEQEGREGMRRIDFNCLKDKATDPRIIQRIAFQFQSKVRLLILPQCFH